MFCNTSWILEGILNLLISIVFVSLTFLVTLSCNANEIFIVVRFEYVISKLTIDYLHRFKFFIFKSLTFLISNANFCSFFFNLNYGFFNAWFISPGFLQFVESKEKKLIIVKVSGSKKYFFDFMNILFYLKNIKLNHFTLKII